MTDKKYTPCRWRVILWRKAPRRDPGRLPAILFAAVFLGTTLFAPRLPGYDTMLKLSARSVGLTEKASERVMVSLPEAVFSAESVPEEIIETNKEEAPAEKAYETIAPAVIPAADEPEIAPENEAILVHKTYAGVPSEICLQVGNAFVRNVTGKPAAVVYEAEAASPAFTAEDTEEPQVLIMHTHTTECYMPYTGNVYDKTHPTRSTDNGENMAAVGAVIAEELEKAGIGVIHDTTQHDYPSYNGSYDRSAATVKGYLAKYPGIKVVLDIHRDAIQSGDTVTAPIIETTEGTAAQVMIIAGCDDGTMGMPNWKENLAFAIDLQQRLEADHPGFTRPILFDYRHYNQDLTTGSLLIEVGGHGNTLPQAMLAGQWIGRSLAAMLTGG